ncbi:MAG: DUF2079 domain-containing protein [Planctomycetes bacterium]|nr:DUF2079 domain-containing protein [Planctomycetota bacterium]
MIPSRRVVFVLFGIAATVWLATYGALSTRLNLLLNYASLPTLLPAWEPIGSTLTSLAIGALFLTLTFRFNAKDPSSAPLQRTNWLLIGAASLPILGSILRHVGAAPSFWQQPHFGELIWFTALSGSALFFYPIDSWGRCRSLTTRPALALLTSFVAIITIFWTYQAWQMHQDFRLGFNDFGHFTWRLANTWNGRGVLLESPTLPMFWDHFNPGMLLIAPVWGLAQSPLTIFVVHALSLSLNAWLIYAIVRRLGGTPLAGLIWGMVWLLHPSLGLWNLAFTYHWHPVTLGVLFFLASIYCVLDRRYSWSAICFLSAASMEEGWLVIGSLTALVIFLFGVPHLDTNDKPTPSARSIDGLSAAVRTAFSQRWGWLVTSISIAIIFVCVYKLSGLAEFQTARFAKLGDSPIAILLSPIYRPSVFFGQVFQIRNFLFLLGLLIPLGGIAVLKGWKFLLATALPMGVLFAWDHQPAASLAFHYATTLMPILFLAAITGAKSLGTDGLLRHGNIALITCLLISIFWGGLPWSPSSTLEADGQSYGAEGITLRRETSSDGRWLHRQIKSLEPHEERSVLATGRIAGHFLRAKFLDTAGQWRERRTELRELSSTGSEWEWVDTLVLDHQENFQQSCDWTMQLQQEALAAGFVIRAEAHGIVILTRAD